MPAKMVLLLSVKVQGWSPPGGESCVPFRKPPLTFATPVGCSKPPLTIGLRTA
jgi:hypothetical protein